jgi:signal transduction histidine kinase/ligand-binding sensor domain-containing protein
MRGLLFLMLFLTAWLCCAQRFTPFHYDMSNGLPDNKVLSAFQDSRGFIWFNSGAGLTRFDGVTFRNYVSTPDFSLAANQSTIVETTHDCLAILCEGKLTRLNTLTHQFDLVPAFRNHRIHDLKEVSNDRFLLAGIDTCFLTDLDFNILEIIVPPPGSAPRPVVGYELNRDRYLIGSSVEHYLYNAGKKEFEPFDILSPSALDHLGFQYYDSVNQWLYFSNYYNGMYRYSLQGKRLKHWEIGGHNLIAPMNDQCLWFGSVTGNSSSTLNLKNDQVTPIRIDNKSEYSAYQLFTDNHGSHWMASDAGITRLIPNNKLIRTWDNFDVNLSRNIFPLAVLKGQDQRIYLTFFRIPFLYQFDNKNDDWELISKNLLTGLWCANVLGNDLVFTGGRTTRFTLYNPVTGWMRDSTDFLKPYFPNSDILILAFRHSNGDQWYSGNKGGGFVRVSADDKTIHHYTKNGPRGKFSWSYYTNYAEDDAGDLWFGVNKSHFLVHWNKKTDSFSEIFFDTIPGYKKINSGINRIIRDNENNLWIGFDGTGVVKYDHLHNQATHYTYEDGLTSGTVGSMAFDNRGRLWIGTRNGLNCLLVKENSIRTFTKVDGLKDDEFREACMFYDSAENKLWVGSTTTVIRFDPDSLIAKSTHQVNVYLDEIHVNGKPLVHNPNELLNLSFKENNVHFRFVAVNLDRREIQLSYRLEGQDDAWVSSLTGTSATYANLDPGRYTFTVKANYRGALDDFILSKPFTLVVATPWFMSWWFRLSIVVSTVLSTVLLVRFYYARKTEKQRLILEKEGAVEKERTRIATDMHDDFGTNLSRIKFLSEKMKLKTQLDDTLKSDLTKISGYSDEMAAKMNEIVWALNERFDSVEDLVSFCRAYAAEYLNQHKIELEFRSQAITAVRLRGEARRNIYLVLKEALHNTVKHSEATRVVISFELSESLRIDYQDNGEGFEWNAVRPFANGLMNMKKRMLDLGGSFELLTSKGVRITLRIRMSEVRV